VVAEHADVGLNPLIVILHLTLSLRVVSGGEVLVNVEGLEEASCVISCEHGASISVVDLWNAMQFPHVLEV
jgi:hypothetical protein